MRRLGRGHVFIDIDSISGGENFPQRLQAALRTCDCVAVLIGPQWRTITDASGQRRLDQPGDYVRYEVETALSSGKRVIPVVVEQTPWPASPSLPPSAQRLADCEPLQLRDTSDLDRVAAQLQRAALQEEIRAMPRVAFPVLLALTMILFLLGILLILRHMLQWISLSPTVDQIVIALFGYGGAFAIGMALWRAAQTRLWWWVTVLAASCIPILLFPFAQQIPATSVLGLALLLFASTGPRLASQLALWRVRMPVKRGGG